MLSVMFQDAADTFSGIPATCLQISAAVFWEKGRRLSATSRESIHREFSGISVGCVSGRCAADPHQSRKYRKTRELFGNPKRFSSGRGHFEEFLGGGGVSGVEIK